ncbi:hypothetical protein HF521_013155, partial [Silurus meridionalis]
HSPTDIPHVPPLHMSTLFFTSLTHSPLLYTVDPSVYLHLSRLFSTCSLLSPQITISSTNITVHKNRRDTGNFDKEFTKMAVELTPTDKLFIMNLDQNEFQGFSYTNPEFVIQV